MKNTIHFLTTFRLQLTVIFNLNFMLHFKQKIFITDTIISNEYAKYKRD